MLQCILRKSAQPARHAPSSLIQTHTLPHHAHRLVLPIDRPSQPASQSSHRSLARSSVRQGRSVDLRYRHTTQHHHSRMAAGVITVTVADEEGRTAVLQVRHACGCIGPGCCSPCLLGFWERREVKMDACTDTIHSQVGGDATVGTLKALVAAEMGVPAAQQVHLRLCPTASSPSVQSLTPTPTHTRITPRASHRPCSRTGSRCGPTTPRSPLRAWATTTSYSSCGGCVACPCSVWSVLMDQPRTTQRASLLIPP